MSRVRVPVALLLATAMLQTPLCAQSAKMTAFAADLTPALEYLAERGITEQRGIRATYDKVEAMFRPMSSEVSAQLIPFGFNNIHVPFALRGDPVPAARRRPGVQLGAAYVKIGDRDFDRLSNTAVIVHELAHAEFFRFKYASKTPRVKRHYDLIYELRTVLQDAGVKKIDWPLYQGSEMAAYYIETSVREVAERIETLFTLNRYRMDSIRSAADRAALIGEDGKDILLVPREDPRVARIFDHPAWKVGGRKGSAFFEGKPIEVAVPENLKLRLYRDVLGLGLPETGEALVEIARKLDSPWARRQRAKIKEARDARVRELRQVAATPDLTGLNAVEGAGATEEGSPFTEEEAAMLERIEKGEGPSSPIPSLLRHAGSHPHPHPEDSASE